MSLERAKLYLARGRSLEIARVYIDAIRQHRESWLAVGKEVGATGYWGGGNEIRGFTLPKGPVPAAMKVDRRGCATPRRTGAGKALRERLLPHPSWFQFTDDMIGKGPWNGIMGHGVHTGPLTINFVSAEEGADGEIVICVPNTCDGVDTPTPGCHPAEAVGILRAEGQLSPRERAHSTRCWRVGGPVDLVRGVCPECGWSEAADIRREAAERARCIFYIRHLPAGGTDALIAEARVAEWRGRYLVGGATKLFWYVGQLDGSVDVRQNEGAQLVGNHASEDDARAWIETAATADGWTIAGSFKEEG